MISLSNKSKFVLKGFAFLQFCKKLDICNENVDARSCAYGKIYAIRHNCDNIDFITKM